MDVEVVKCECCGLREDCTLDYINGVKAKFNGKWLCGLCSEAVRDEICRSSSNEKKIEDAVKAHVSFCRKYTSNPAFRVADGMRLMLRRRSSHTDKNFSQTPLSGNKYCRSASTSQVGDESSFS